MLRQAGGAPAHVAGALPVSQQHGSPTHTLVTLSSFPENLLTDCRHLAFAQLVIPGEGNTFFLPEIHLTIFPVCQNNFEHIAS